VIGVERSLRRGDGGSKPVEIGATAGGFDLPHFFESDTVFGKVAL
jgi:hypothetical protein